MTANIKEELKSILREIKTQSDAQRLKPRIKRFLAEVTPADLAIAEQELLKEGLDVEDLRKLCGPHLELLRERLEAQRPIEPDHPIGILMAEHEVILGKLDELENIVKQAEIGEGELERLRDVAHHLLDAESHHKREEEVLFPELEARGVTGPPMIMRTEHEELRAKKHELHELIGAYAELRPEEFKAKLTDVGSFLVGHLRDHIFKEDRILYPTAMAVIEDGRWSEIKARFDRIGYCCFTPRSN